MSVRFQFVCKLLKQVKTFEVVIPIVTKDGDNKDDANKNRRDNQIERLQDKVEQGEKEPLPTQNKKAMDANHKSKFKKRSVIYNMRQKLMTTMEGKELTKWEALV